MAMGLLVIDDNTPTGYYGELTEAAVRRFQEQQGLPVTGTACAETLKKLLDLRTIDTFSYFSSVKVTDLSVCS